MKQAKVRRRLVSAVGTECLLEIRRTSERGALYTGYVLAVGKQWVLVARTMDGGFFDGYILFRLRDLAEVRTDGSFAPRASRLLPEWPPRFPRPLEGIDLDTTAGVLRTVPADQGRTHRCAVHPSIRRAVDRRDR